MDLFGEFQVIILNSMRNSICVQRALKMVMPRVTSYYNTHVLQLEFPSHIERLKYTTEISLEQIMSKRRFLP